MSSEGKNMVFVLPVLAVVFILAFLFFVRMVIGPTSHQERDLWTTDFVPAETPQSSGAHSR